MTSVVSWNRSQLRAAADEVLDVYAEAMAVPRQQAAGRRSILTSHLDRDGLRTVAARDAAGRLVGVAYGHRGEPGQWWHDRVRASLATSLGDPAASAWMDDAFEVCELHVRPAQQGTGLGRELLDALLDGVPAAVAVLTTPDSETRARAFYRAGGWVDLVRRLRFPGDPREFAVLGLQLAPSTGRTAVRDLGSRR